VEKQSYDFWYNNPKFDNLDQFKEKYYVNDFYKNIVFNLNIPSGDVVVMGTNRGVAFELLCEEYGEKRCVGYDLFNPSEHPKIITRDCMSLSDKDNTPIAFAHNDIGNFSDTPELKTHAQKWLADNIVKGGYVLCNNNDNEANFKIEEFMESKGFENTQLEDLDRSIFDLSDLSYKLIKHFMISRKL
jgi:hypothetical protein